MGFQKQKPTIITYCKYKTFDNEKFRSDALKLNFDKNNLDNSKDTLSIFLLSMFPKQRNMSVPMRLLIWQKTYIKTLCGG